MGISTAQSTRENGLPQHTATKQQQQQPQQLDIEQLLTQLTLEEKVSLTAGMQFVRHPCSSGHGGQARRNH
jgi:beta-glucosidase